MMQTVATDARIELPPRFKCPICGAKIYLDDLTGWTQDDADGTWYASEIGIQCETVNTGRFASAIRKRRGVMPKISIRFEPRDMWIGAYWDKVGYVTRVYVCVVPCFPILFKWRAPEE